MTEQDIWQDVMFHSLELRTEPTVCIPAEVVLAPDTDRPVLSSLEKVDSRLDG